MKYNNSEKYVQLKDKVYIQQKFNSGEWLDKINLEKQAKHIESTRIEGKSHFFNDVDIFALYSKFKGTGELRKNKNGRTNKEVIDLSEGLRFGIDVYSGKFANGITIHYGKTGSHIIPTYYEVE